VSASPFFFLFLGDSSARVWSPVRVGYVPELGQADARAQVPAATVACSGAWRADHRVYWRALAGVVDVLDSVLRFCLELLGIGSLHACQTDVRWVAKYKEQNVSPGLIYKKLNLMHKEHESNQSSSGVHLNAVRIFLPSMRVPP
jgi:hypothetical protein